MTGVLTYKKTAIWRHKHTGRMPCEGWSDVSARAVGHHQKLGDWHGPNVWYFVTGALGNSYAISNC